MGVTIKKLYRNITNRLQIWFRYGTAPDRAVLIGPFEFRPISGEALPQDTKAVTKA